MEMEKLANLLEAQDHFYSSFQLYFKGKLRVHSVYSTVFSIIINVTCIAMFITLLIELASHSKPTVTFAKLSAHVTTNMTLNSKELLYTIGLRDKFYNDLTDPSIVTLEAVYARMIAVNGELNEEVIPLDLINCTSLYPLFDDLGLGSVFNSTGLKNYNCYNGTTFDEPIVVGGKYGSNFYGNLGFNIRRCINGTSAVICKSEAEINEALQHAWLQVTYVSSFVDFNNFSTPIQYITEDFYTNIDLYLTKIAYQYFNPVFIYSENNIIFSNQKIESATKGERQTIDIITPSNDGLVYSLYVCPSYTVEKYFRRYMKIQELGASVGGFWSGISVVWFLLLTKFQLRDLQMKLVNAIFEFTSTQPIDSKYSVFNPMKPLPGAFKASTYSKTKMYEVNYGFFNSFKMLLCPCRLQVKKMNKEYSQVFKEIMNYSDFTQIFHGFQDIEKLKLLIGNKPHNAQMPASLNCDAPIDWQKEKKLIEIGNDNNINTTTSFYRAYLTNKDNCDSKQNIRSNEQAKLSVLRNQPLYSSPLYINSYHKNTVSLPKHTSVNK